MNNTDNIIENKNIYGVCFISLDRPLKVSFVVLFLAISIPTLRKYKIVLLMGHTCVFPSIF